MAVSEPRRLVAPGKLSGDDELLTLEEVAAILKLPVATLRKWRVEGKGPAGFRLGKYIRYRRSTVEAFIKEQEDAEWR
jgi:excisionase family DNA binding protein